MKKNILAVSAVLFLISACSSFNLNSLNPFSSDEKQTQEKEVGVNAYLWQASLNRLAFMPLLTADSNGGIIITDWSSMGGAASEQFKITVNITSKMLRTDCLSVVVSKRVLENGRWVDVKADKRLAEEIEKSILAEARKLYRRDMALMED